MSETISAAKVKELREATGAAMMECKKALVLSQGDMDKAIEELRKAGITKAGKKAGRLAAEGIIVMRKNDVRAAMVEVNSETDFVARDENFVNFAAAVAETALQSGETSLAKFAELPLHGQTSKTVEQARQELVSKVGENVQIRRIVVTNPGAVALGAYLHGTRIGVLVELDADNKDLAHDIAMHIAASKPVVITPDHVSPDIVAKEKEIYAAQAATSGKPQEIIEKMVMGRLKNFLDEVSLTGQPFVKEPETTVGNLLNKHRAKVLAFYRYEVGEGMEKVTEDFAEAVMLQVQGR